jgi:hypothetical protein
LAQAASHCALDVRRWDLFTFSETTTTRQTI